MSDWASRAAAEDLVAEKAERLRSHKNEENGASLEDRRGAELFRELHSWIMRQVFTYNDRMGRNVLDASIPHSGKYEFTVFHIDKTKQPLKIEYFPESHRLRSESGAGKNEYCLINQDGEIQFETPYHQIKIIEEIGEELLTQWRTSQF